MYEKSKATAKNWKRTMNNNNGDVNLMNNQSVSMSLSNHNSNNNNNLNNNINNKMKT